MNISDYTVFSLTTEPVEVISEGFNIFTYQATGVGAVSIQGSNDGVNWVNVNQEAMVAPTSLVAIHTWRYLKATLAGTAKILVSRG